METATIPQPTFYLFKCEQSAPSGMPKPACVNEQTQDLYNYLTQGLMQKGIMGPVQAIRTACLGRCQFGPVMLVEPGHYMYCHLSKEKIDKIIDNHILNKEPVIEYLIPEQFWAEPISLGK